MRGLWWRASLAFLLAASVAAEALARPGGGQMFGGGGGGGGGFDGGGELEVLVFRILLWLCLEHPVIGIPLTIVVVTVYTVHRKKNGGFKKVDWDAGVVSMAPMPQLCRRSKLEKLREKDPDFSVVLFEDFLYDLYAEAHRRRAKGELDHLSAYLGPQPRRTLKNLSPEAVAVEGVIIGGMRVVGVVGVDTDPGLTNEVRIQVAFETNYTEVSDVKGKHVETTFYAVEQWSLMRSASAKSRPPDRVGVFACPGCGGAQSRMDEGVCGYCGEKVDTGAYDWTVTAIQVHERKERPPNLPLHPHGEYSPGLDKATVVGPGAEQRFKALCERDPKTTREEFEARVSEVFHALQVAWSELDWTKARPFVTDRLYQSQQFWIDAYKKAGMRNVIEEPEITWIELSATTSDKWFDAVTVRVYAKSYDYTIDTATGKVVGGNKKVRHGYSEYWTFVRGRKAKGGGEPGRCPNCGAELKITTGGVCEYCEAKVTSGDFDWVLSRIEQDQAYTC